MNDHLAALQTRLSHEKQRLAAAKTSQERALRTVWIQQIQREIDRELPPVAPTMSDDELMRELIA